MKITISSRLVGWLFSVESKTKIMEIVELIEIWQKMKDVC